MSRSALVTIRWSKTKLPLSEPATRRSEGSHWRRSASARISSSDSSRASGGTHAGIHSQSASKWQSSVSVSRRAGPPQRGQVVWTNSSSSASGLPAPVGLMSSGSSTGSCFSRQGNGAALLAVDDRDRRAPRALAGYRAVVGAVAHSRACAERHGIAACATRARARFAVARAVLAGALREVDAEPAGDHLVGAVARGNTEHGGRDRSVRRRQARSAPAAGSAGAGSSVRCRSAGSSRPRASYAPSHLSAAPRAARGLWGRMPSGRHPDAWAEISTKRASASASAWGVNTVSASTLPGADSSISTPSMRPSTKLLGGERDLVPFAAGGALLQTLIVLVQIGADAQVPLRALDQPDGVVTAPADASLDLDRGERRLAGIAPVDIPATAVDEAGLEQARNSHCDQRYMSASELRNERSQSKEKPSRSSCPVMWAAQRVTHSLGDSPPAIAPSSAGRPKASKPKANSTASPRARRETGVGVADRVGADVADVHVPRGEGSRGLDVLARLLRRSAAGVRKASRARQAACRRASIACGS